MSSRPENWSNTDSLEESDIEQWQTVLDHAYGQNKLSPVVIVDGYAVSLAVKDGQLVISDGVGTHARRRILSRADRTVRRIVVLGRSGTLTLAALRWCNEVGISVAIIDPDNTLTAVTVSPNPNDARLRRAQALAAGTPLGNSIAAELIATKIEGHAAIAARWDTDQADTLRKHAAALRQAPSLPVEGLREVEAFCAATFFSLWTANVEPTFATRERARIPQHWLGSKARKSPLTRGGSPRSAADPVNALLNYGYALGEATVTHACLVVGLDPALGVMHADKKNRDSLTLDLLEPLRPIIEDDILRLLAARRFRKSDFIETPQGQCKLTESVTHQLAEALPSWAAAIAPTVEWVAHELAASSPSKITVRTPLTQQRRLDARASDRPRRGTKPPKTPTQVRSCRDCGTPLNSEQSKLCSACWIIERERLARDLGARSGETRRRLINKLGHDPTQTPEARSRRVESLKTERTARDAWDAEHTGQQFDREAFAREIVPSLANISLGTITTATGMSSSAASRIRSGKLDPHPRHWEVLRALCGL